MTILDDLRASLTELQSTILNAIWHYEMELDRGIPSIKLCDTLGVEDTEIDDALKQLGVDAVYPDGAARTLRRYQLTFLGYLLAERGEELEDLLVRYLNYARQQLRSDPENQKINLQAAIESSGFSSEQGEFFLKMFFRTPFHGNGSRTETNLPPHIDDWYAHPDLRAYLSERTLGSRPGKTPGLSGRQTVEELVACDPFARPVEDSDGIQEMEESYRTCVPNLSITELLEGKFTDASDTRLRAVALGDPDASIMGQLLSMVPGISHSSSIRYLAPGRSGAKVVVLMNPDSLPVVLKFGTKKDIEREQQNYRNSQVEERLAQQVRPTLRQLLTLGDYALLVYSWAGGWEQVKSFRDFFRSAQPERLDHFLTSLMKELFPWHHARKANVLPFDLWQWDETTLTQLLESIQLWNGDRATRERLIAVLYDQNQWRDLLLTKRGGLGTCHGDLNCYNVLISDADALPKIIDFASVSLRDSPARDYAKLEREIKLRCLRDLITVPSEFIEALEQVDRICDSGQYSATDHAAATKAAVAITSLRNQFSLRSAGVSDIPFIEYLYFLLCWTLAYLSNQEGKNEPKEVRDAIIGSAIRIMGRLDREVRGETKFSPLTLHADFIQEDTRVTADATQSYDKTLQDYLRALSIFVDNPPYLALDQILSGEKRGLKDIYVPLRVRLIRVVAEQPATNDQGDESRTDGQALDQHTGEQQIRPSDQSIVENEAIPAIGTLAHVLAAASRRRLHRDLVLQGAAGTGKSTALRHITTYAFLEPQLLGLDRPHLPMVVRLQVLANVGGASLEERLLNSLRRAGDLVLEQTPPNGFFQGWSKLMDSPWLLLLDGLDEVAVEQREETLRWIKDLLLRLEGQHRVVLTSRPADDELYRSLTSNFTVAEVLPFDEAQRRDFARRWFADAAEDFLTQVSKIGAGNLFREPLAMTPLLLTIAAAVYRKNGDLPASGQMELYAKFIEILFDEAGRRGLWAELGEEVSDVAKGGLEELALSMTVDPETNTLPGLTPVCAGLLKEQLSWHAVRAEGRAEQFIEVLSKRSGVFYKQGEIFQWVHPTIREYLAAEALERKLRYSNNDYQTVLGDHLKDEKWRGVLWSLSLTHKDREELIRWMSRQALDTFDASVALLAHECWRETDNVLAEGLRAAIISGIAGGLGHLQSSLATEARLRQHLIEIGNDATEQIVALVNDFNGLQLRLLPEWNEKRHPDVQTETGHQIYSGFRLRYNLIDVLGEIGDEHSVEPLISWLNQDDKHDSYRRDITHHARSALKCIGLPAVGPLLTKIRNATVATDVRLDCLTALSAVGIRSTSVAPVLEFCLDEGLRGDAKLLASSLRSATALRDRQHSARAILALSSEDNDVVAAAASYLSQMPEALGSEALDIAFSKARSLSDDSFATNWTMKRLAVAISALGTTTGAQTITDLIKLSLAEHGELSADEAIQLADEVHLRNLPTLLLDELLRRVKFGEPGRTVDSLVTKIGETWRPDATRLLVASGVESIGSANDGEGFSDKLIDIYLQDAAKISAQDRSFGISLDGKPILRLMAKCEVSDFAAQAVRLLPGAEFWLVRQVSDALWLVGDPSAEDGLIAALEDFQRPSMQSDRPMPEEFDIIRALGTCSTERGAEVVINYVRQNPDLSIYVPEEVLCPLVRRRVVDVNTLSAMAVDDKETHEYVRRACVLALGYLDTPAFTPVFLDSLATESDELTRGHAAFFLGWAKTERSNAINSLKNLLTKTDKLYLAEQAAKSLVRLEERDALHLIENTIERFGNVGAVSGLLRAAARFHEPSTLRLLEKVNSKKRPNAYGQTEAEIIAAFGEFYHADPSARAVVDAQLEDSSSGLDAGRQRFAVSILAARNPNALLQRATTLYDEGLLDPSACGTLINCIPEINKSKEIEVKWLAEILMRFLCDQSLSIREAAAAALQFTSASFKTNLYDQLQRTGSEWAQACAVYSLGFWDSDERMIESARFDSSPLVRRSASIALGVRTKRSDLSQISQSFQINHGLLRLSAYYSLLEHASEATVGVLRREMKEDDPAGIYFRELRGGIEKRSQDERQKRIKEEEDEICDRRRCVSFA